jgi:hypothetical protein
MEMLLSPNDIGLLMVSPLVIKTLTCFLSSVAAGSNHPKDVETAYACILAHSGEILSMNEDDFAALQKEMSALESRRCDREGREYEDRYCGGHDPKCYQEQYDRCERSYEGHTYALMLDSALDWVSDNWASLRGLERYHDDK